jgi:hypothetical protein
MITWAWTVHAITLPALSSPIALSLNKRQKGTYLYTQLLSFPPKTFSNAGIMLSNLSIDSSAKSDAQRAGGILGTLGKMFAFLHSIWLQAGNGAHIPCKFPVAFSK